MAEWKISCGTGGMSNRKFFVSIITFVVVRKIVIVNKRIVEC